MLPKSKIHAPLPCKSKSKPMHICQMVHDVFLSQCDVHLQTYLNTTIYWRTKTHRWTCFAHLERFCKAINSAFATILYVCWRCLCHRDREDARMLRWCVFSRIAITIVSFPLRTLWNWTYRLHLAIMTPANMVRRSSYIFKSFGYIH